MPESPDSSRFSFGRERKPEKPPEAGPPAEESDELDLSKVEGCYASISANKALTRMHVIMGDGAIETVYYDHMDAKGSFKGKKFMKLFAGTKFWELRVEGFGPKMWRVYDLISLFRMPYIRQATPNEVKFAKEGETIFSKIELVDVTPKDDGTAKDGK